MVSLQNEGTALTSDFIRAAIGPSVWDFGNEVLYRLCKEHPRHDSEEIVIAKVWLIGRSYAAAIERRRTVRETTAGDRFYECAVAPGIRQSKIDSWLRSLDTDKSGGVDVPLKVHGKVTDLFSTISQMQKRSLASKYLHFHFPERFYIYDSRACTALARLARPPRRPHVLGTDRQYAAFVHRCDALNERVRKVIGRRLSARELDKVLLAYKARAAGNA
jgi:hypothetical protein